MNKKRDDTRYIAKPDQNEKTTELYYTSTPYVYARERDREDTAREEDS